MIAALERENKRLREELEANRWIPVSERLPQTGLLCLVVYSDCVQQVGYRRSGYGFACADGYAWEPAECVDSDPIPDEEVTHWRPFPDPPKL